MTDLDAARAWLAEYYTPICGWPLFAEPWDLDPGRPLCSECDEPMPSETYICPKCGPSAMTCNLPIRHDGDHALNFGHAASAVGYLRAALAEVDRLTTENTALRALAQRAACAYGHRSPEGVCRLGYPGCACADDLACWDAERGPVLAVELREARAEVERLTIERDEARAVASGELRAVAEVCAQVDRDVVIERDALRAEVERLKGERAAVVAYLRDANECGSLQGWVGGLADEIEQGCHRGTR